MREKQKRNSILDFLSVDEHSQFLSDILESIEISRETKKFDAINKCIADWEAVAELKSIEGFAENTESAYKALVDMGIIDGH